MDGASNIKLEVFDFDTLEAIHSIVTETPVTEFDGYCYNQTANECKWFDRAIKGHA